MKKKFVYILIFIVIILCLISAGLLIDGRDSQQLSAENFPILTLENQKTIFPSPSTEIHSEKLNQVDITKSRDISSEISNKITFTAGNNIYQVSISKDSSVYDVMTYLSASSVKSFIFEAENYPGLGYFIKSINGVKNTDGYYWTLYVNGKYSTVGASDYKLSNGDKIEWKYEKNL